MPSFNKTGTSVYVRTLSMPHTSLRQTTLYARHFSKAKPFYDRHPSKRDTPLRQTLFFDRQFFMQGTSLKAKPLYRHFLCKTLL